MVNYALLSGFLLLMMLVSLLFARWISQREEQAVTRIRRLRALEKRKDRLEQVIDALHDMGADQSVIAMLHDRLLRDLERIRQLDPTRPDINAMLGKAEAAAKRKSSAPPQEEAAVSSDRELAAVRRHMQNALQLLTRFYRHGYLSNSDFRDAREKLRSLAVNIGVNSYMLMAGQALERRNTMKAFSLYRKAESMLNRANLRKDEQERRLALIESEKQRLMEQYEDEKGLLLLASAD